MALPFADREFGARRRPLRCVGGRTVRCYRAADSPPQRVSGSENVIGVRQCLRLVGFAQDSEVAAGWFHHSHDTRWQGSGRP